MVSLFKKSYNAESPIAQTVRVLVIGDQNVGKTALSELIVTKKPSRPSKSTAGCAVSVALWDVSDDGGSSSGGAVLSAFDGQGGRDSQTFFVEIWDVSANPYYEQLRRTLYKQINGVILVYDSTDKTSLRRLTKWALEVASDGTFVAPFSDGTAARNIGGLPVPILVVANKCDRLRLAAGGAAGSSALGAAITKLCGARSDRSDGGAIARLCSSIIGCRWPRGSRGGAGSAGGLPVSMSGPSLPDLEGQVRSVSASAATGQLDWGTVGAFFTALWARRFQPNPRGSAQFLQQLGGGVGYRSEALFSPAASPMTKDRRLDDDDDDDREDRRVDDVWA